MKFPEMSRRKFLKKSATGGAATLGGLVTAGAGSLPLALSQAAAAQHSDDRVKMNSPGDGEVLKSCLTARLEWDYALKEKAVVHGRTLPYWNYLSVKLKVCPSEDMSRPIVDVDLPDHITSWRFPVLPQQKYYWQIIPRDETGERLDLSSRGNFATGTPVIDETTDSDVRYKNARRGAHFRHMKPVSWGDYEPLSPWYEIEAYNSPPLPHFEAIKDKFPVPVYDGHPEALEAYWYCWRTFVDQWNFPPEAPDHQAVANINGTRSWGPWGSSQVWDSAFMMYFARYGHHAYPFITQYDNAYARQHENGFICRESDKNNRELYSSYPVGCPFLMGWAEWKYYQLTGDKERLQRVLLPNAKNFEWHMTYMRSKKDGLYWNEGFTSEQLRSYIGDALVYTVGNSATRAAEALALSRIATVVGREDMAEFFRSQHRQISRIMNETLWDATHGIYNDRCDPAHPNVSCRERGKTGEFVTEIAPGIIDKHVEMLYPLFGEVVPKERMPQVIREVRNPDSFNRLTGVPNLSADSTGYNRSSGTVWPPPQCLVQEGLRASGEVDVAQELAEKYFRAVVATYHTEKTIKESILADKLEFSGAPDFVGWGGLGPVANFIEYVLGFEVSVPDRVIRWHITKTERHGIRNLGFGDVDVDLICDRRANVNEPCRVTANSGGSFRLRTVVNGKTTETHIDKGTATVQVG